MPIAPGFYAIICLFLQQVLGEATSRMGTNTAQCWSCTAPQDSLLFIFLFLIMLWYYTAQIFQLGIYVSFMPVFVGLKHNSKSTSCRWCDENCHLQCVCIINMIQLNLLISQLLNFFHGFTAHITQYTYNIQYLATKSRGSSYFKNNFMSILSDVAKK